MEMFFAAVHQTLMTLTTKMMPKCRQAKGGLNTAPVKASQFSELIDDATITRGLDA